MPSRPQPTGAPAAGRAPVDDGLPEPELILLAQQGDEDAFAVVVGRYEAQVTAITRSICGDLARAEDAAQEAFLSAWRGLGGFVPTEPFAPWLFTIARNAARRTFRHKVGEPADAVPLEALGLAAGWGQSPELLAQAHEDLDAVARALEQLPEGDREVIWLRDVEGLTGVEAARALGIPLAALKTRLHRARLRLMAELRGGEDG